jgi:hypothetical protein
MDAEKTKVIFRMFGDGQVIALFPEIATDQLGYNCNSYMHVGQHGAANPSITNRTTLAKQEDYKHLFDELTKLGYNLHVIKRFRYADQLKRQKQATAKVVI